ncbi:MAG TPA: DinB family protein [Bryobacteraceae bacterium]|nr:DinB family protein [Bryobacteraceae bacterium]
MSALIFAATSFAQAPKPEFGMAWMPEFNATTRELVSLAEATPPEKFAWRPAPGVRSISEVYVHIAVAHMFFLTQSGVKADMSKVTRDAEKKIMAKADVIAFLKESIAAVEENYPKMDLKKKVKFIDAETTVEGIMIHLISHTNEHLGQSIAYARMNGIVPPWSN